MDFLFEQDKCIVPYNHNCLCFKLRILSTLGFCHCVLFVIEEYSYNMLVYGMLKEVGTHIEKSTL